MFDHSPPDAAFAAPPPQRPTGGSVPPETGKATNFDTRNDNDGKSSTCKSSSYDTKNDEDATVMVSMSAVTPTEGNIKAASMPHGSNHLSEESRNSNNNRNDGAVVDTRVAKKKQGKKKYGCEKCGLIFLGWSSIRTHMLECCPERERKHWIKHSRKVAERKDPEIKNRKDTERKNRKALVSSCTTNNTCLPDSFAVLSSDIIGEYVDVKKIRQDFSGPDGQRLDVEEFLKRLNDDAEFEATKLPFNIGRARLLLQENGHFLVICKNGDEIHALAYIPKPNKGLLICNTDPEHVEVTDQDRDILKGVYSSSKAAKNKAKKHAKGVFDKRFDDVPNTLESVYKITRKTEYKITRKTDENALTKTEKSCVRKQPLTKNEKNRLKKQKKKERKRAALERAALAEKDDKRFDDEPNTLESVDKITRKTDEIPLTKTEKNRIKKQKQKKRKRAAMAEKTGPLKDVTNLY